MNGTYTLDILCVLKLFAIFVTVMLPCIAFDGGIWQVERMESLYARMFLKLSFILDKIWTDFAYEMESHTDLLIWRTS